jgi:hypothetical protein
MPTTVTIQKLSPFDEPGKTFGFPGLAPWSDRHERHVVGRGLGLQPRIDARDDRVARITRERMRFDERAVETLLAEELSGGASRFGETVRDDVEPFTFVVAALVLGET